FGDPTCGSPASPTENSSGPTDECARPDEYALPTATLTEGIRSMTTQATASRTDAVRATLDQLYEAWTANDADAFAALYREDATVVLAGAFQRGRPAVRDH